MRRGRGVREKREFYERKKYADETVVTLYLKVGVAGGGKRGRVFKNHPALGGKGAYKEDLGRHRGGEDKRGNTSGKLEEKAARKRQQE